MPGAMQTPWDLITCPDCQGTLEARQQAAVCKNCHQLYPAHRENGLDLRLRKPRTVSLDFELGTTLFADGRPDFLPLGMNPNPEVRFQEGDLPMHLSPEMASHLPKASRPDSVCLDLGCGNGSYRGPIQKAGYRWIGIDYGDDSAPMLADAHAMPFKDNTFDLVVSLAVLEHIRYPHVMINEVNRVLRPGGIFLGSVTYIMPFHLNSYYNMTHLGTLSVLRHAGFEVQKVASDKKYLGIRAIAFSGLFLGAPRRLAYAAVWPIVVLHRLWWWFANSLPPRGRFDDRVRLLHNTGAFVFIARKSAERAASH